jgi:MFS family permease
MRGFAERSARPKGDVGVKHARIAISVLFAMNGFMLTAWLPRLFEMQQRLGLSDGQLGAALSAGAVGGLVAGLLAAPAVARWGSARVAVTMTFVFAPALPLLGLAPSLAVFALAMAWIGAADAIQDAAVNAHGVRVQAIYGRSILNGLHGFWSLGTVAGTTLGTISLALNLSLTVFLTVIAVIGVIAVVSTARWLLPAPDPHSHGATQPGPARRPWSMIIWLLGFYIVLAVIVEDVPARWSSIYLSSLDASGFVVGLGLVTFTSAMTVGRFTGDRLVDAYGSSRVVQVSMAAAGLALGAALIVGTAWAFIASCLVIGYGVATLFPSAMRAAAHLPGIRPATGIAIVSWIARSAFVIAPLAVGTIADNAGLAWGLGVPVLAAFAVIALSPVVSDRRRGSQ